MHIRDGIPSMDTFRSLYWSLPFDASNTCNKNALDCLSDVVWADAAYPEGLHVVGKTYSLHEHIFERPVTRSKH
jgi:hypothetical protein